MKPEIRIPTETSIPPERTDFERLLSRFSHHTAMGASLIVALPQRLIEWLEREAPNFLTSEQLEFEYALADGGRTGFFQGQSFVHPLLQRPPHRGSLLSSPGILEEKNGAKRHRLPESRERTQKEIDERRVGFAGWLVTQPEFHRNRAAFFKRWRPEWERFASCGLPAIQLMNSHDLSVRGRTEDFLIQYLDFCTEHSIDSIVAGEFPIPSDTQITVLDSSGANLLPKAGVLLFLPWHILREDSLALREIAGQHAKLLAPEIVRSWIDKSSEYGHIRHGAMFYLYVYLEMALKQRYGPQIRSHTNSVDTAFSAYLRSERIHSDIDPEIREPVRKVRLEMQRRLRSCRNTRVPRGKYAPRQFDPVELRNERVKITEAALRR